MLELRDVAHEIWGRVKNPFSVFEHPPVEQGHAGGIDLNMKVRTMSLDHKRLARQKPNDSPGHPVDVNHVIGDAPQPENGGQVHEQTQRHRDSLRGQAPVCPKIRQPHVIDGVTGIPQDACLRLGNPRDVVDERDSGHASTTRQSAARTS